jgi:hypothetical protein
MQQHNNSTHSFHHLFTLLHEENRTSGVTAAAAAAVVVSRENISTKWEAREIDLLLFVLTKPLYCQKNNDGGCHPPHRYFIMSKPQQKQRQ